MKKDQAPGVLFLLQADGYGYIGGCGVGERQIMTNLWRLKGSYILRKVRFLAETEYRFCQIEVV